MRHRSIKSRAGKVMLGAVLAGALSGAGANIARATLTLDLEAGSGTPNNPSTSVTGVTAGSTVPIEVYAVVTDGAGSAANDGLGAVFGSYDAAGSAATGMTFAVKSPFNYNLGAGVASNGGTYTYSDSNSVTHVGVGPYSGAATGGPATVASSNYNSASPTNWAFDAYIQNSGTSVSSIFTGGTALTAGNGAYYDLGTLTLSTSGSAANGSSIAVTGVGRTQQTGAELSALWTENGAIESPGAGSAIAADDTVTVGIGAVVTAHAGDTAPQNGHVVGLYDLTNVINYYGTTNPAGYAYPDTAANDSSAVGLADLTYVINNYGLGNSNEPTSIIASVPEPASLGLLALGGLFAVQRRRK